MTKQKIFIIRLVVGYKNEFVLILTLFTMKLEACFSWATIFLK